MSSELTLPIELGRWYKRRDGKIVQATLARGFKHFLSVQSDGHDVGDVLVSAETGRIWLCAAPDHPHDLIADAEAPIGCDERFVAAAPEGTDEAADAALGIKRPHPHAALMALYAQDAAETETPWKRWQWRDPLIHEPRWSDCRNDFMFSNVCEYRRKPKTIRIGEFDVPEPLREAPEADAKVWFATILTQHGAWNEEWRGTETQRRWLAHGIVHTTREAAEQHARALLSFTSEVKE